MEVRVPQDNNAVTATPFLQWATVPAVAPAAATMVAIPFSTFARTFLGRCRLSAAPADAAVFGALSPAELGLLGAGAGRILLGLDESGAFAKTFTDKRDWDAWVVQLTLADPSKFLLTAADLQRGEAMTTPGVAAVPAVPAVPAVARGRRRAGAAGAPARAGVPGVAAVAAVPAVAPPAALQYLEYVSVASLEDSGAAAPLGRLGFFLGALGPVQTKAARDRVTSQAYVVSLSVVSALRKRHHVDAVGAAGDAAIAYHLGPFLDGCRLPEPLRSPESTVAELSHELLAGIQYTASPEGRAAVEARRVICLTTRYARQPHLRPPPARARIWQPQPAPAHPGGRRPQGAPSEQPRLPRGSAASIRAYDRPPTIAPSTCGQRRPCARPSDGLAALS
jgi:hypothetical protein